MEFKLSPYHRDVPDDALLADLRAVASKLNATSLTKGTYEQHGRFCAETVRRRFRTWNFAIAAAGLSPTKFQNVAAEELIVDIQRVARLVGVAALTGEQYYQHGRYSQRVVSRHFGTWKRAAKTAHLEAAQNYQISDEDLFENMEQVWRHLGRQPTVTEMAPPLSRFCGKTYATRFGGYRKALEAFVAAVDDGTSFRGARTAEPISQLATAKHSLPRHRTPRTLNWRLRFLTLRRDGFRCRACGRSPANEAGVELEVDHVLAWSEGGETILENLQSLCQQCNGGKSNLPFRATE
jgi:hypothetical protein